MFSISAWKQKARQVKQEVFALYMAMGDRRTPWYARALLVIIIAYAVSPVDIIPDFIPVLGYLDDLVLIPAGIALVTKLIPHEVMEECRTMARETRVPRKAGWIAAGVIILFWLMVILWIARQATT